MTLTIEVPDKVVEKAAALGVPVGALVLQAIEKIGEEAVSQEDWGSEAARKRAQEAGASMREIQSRSTLGGLKIKDLIEEGRRF